MDRSLPAPAGPSPARYWFAGLRLEADGTLRRGEANLCLPPRELTVLRLLLARAGKIIPPIELKRVVFGDVPASSDSVSKCVASLRAILEPIDCIQKVYKRGFRMAAEVRVDRSSPSGTLPRLAILPLVAGYGVPEHLALGVAEYAMERLSSARDAIATIVAQEPVFTLARRGLSPQEIGRTLDADLVLTGRLEAAPTHDRLRAEMIRVEDGAQLWVEDRIAARPQIGDLTFALVDLVTWRLQANGPAISRLAYSI